MLANDRRGIVNLLPKQPKYYRKNRCHSQKTRKKYIVTVFGGTSPVPSTPWRASSIANKMKSKLHFMAFI